MNMDDSLVGEIQPSQGRVVMIESDEIGLRWLGILTSYRQKLKSGSLTCTCASFENVLKYRVMSDNYTVSGQGAGAVVGGVLDSINAINRTGIERGVIETLNVIDVNLSRRPALTAVQSVMKGAEGEWWLETTTAPGSVWAELHVEKHRGSDVSSQIVLAENGNATFEECKVDGLAAAYSVVAEGGQQHQVQPFNSTPKASAKGTIAKADAPHGYSVGVGVSSPGPITRREKLALVETLRTQGNVEAAASVLQNRSRFGVTRSIRCSVWSNERTLNIPDLACAEPGSLKRKLWNSLVPGNVVTIMSSELFISGYKGAARILGVQPDEEKGVLKMSLQPVGGDPS